MRNPQDTYFIFILLLACTISSGLTWVGVRNIYKDVASLAVEKEREDKISSIIVMKKLQECSVQFGNYIATKGKYGRNYFEGN